MDEGKRMIEMARLQHEQAQQATPQQTIYNSIEKVFGSMSDRTKKATASYNNACRDLFYLLGANEYYRIFHSVQAIKYIAIGISAAICDLLIFNNVTDTKDIVKDYRQGVNIFFHDLMTLPSGTERMMEKLAQWWMDDGLKQIVDNQHYAYANIVCKDGISSNVADLAAWLFTVRDLAQAVILHDDEIVPIISKVMKEHNGYSYRNSKDVAYTIERFATALITNLFGHDIVPKDPVVATGRKAFLTQIKLYDAFTNLCDYYSHAAIAESNRTCPSDRCRECQLFPCKTRKSVNRQMQKFIEDK